MKYPDRIIVVAIFGILIFLIIGIIAIEIYNLTGKVCDYCNDRFHEEGWQVREFWICNRCADALGYYATEILGEEWNAKKMEFIWQQIYVQKDRRVDRSKQ